ncbi:hypothetical protein RhiirA5_507355 [Rhizophagus irregularis]|uniref:Cytochrome P450 n=1 Tax=Rhizophagus irregularis TaxID=588596 RepID=A0A2I1FHY3_9GLOM|nr:hypothetical protein RhiirA5_507355 [Rhizophagus irregularis]PKY33991.1 hypothetical protein RhiirB3_532672 [Rhizophagus irregularis]CAB4388481.1 unnamed protein product [Rhizophagus irregularis]CAB5217126.1 unnamed protein product [Rhizophagus irregularis]CAB5381558.1 unnamed protein product [Rhizophagus irregularis]
MKLAANALTTILYLLAVHKDVQKKVRDEILRVLDDYLMPSVEQQKELKYMNIKQPTLMNMVINENLRLFPLVSQLPRRFNLLGLEPSKKTLAG